VLIAERKKERNGKNNLNKKNFVAMNSTYKDNRNCLIRLEKRWSKRNPALTGLIIIIGNRSPPPPPPRVVVAVVIETLVIMPISKNILIIKLKN
jgi:hypothetical protein